ncbi:hypothetical protein Pst134EB_002142 [Puccinia striiformis f. sp. tritici]|nr:hypothetical protein Pst134EB_002142 [Puccinia striiformis f. sp. tritici]
MLSSSRISPSSSPPAAGPTGSSGSNKKKKKEKEKEDQQWIEELIEDTDQAWDHLSDHQPEDHHRHHHQITSTSTGSLSLNKPSSSATSPPPSTPKLLADSPTSCSSIDIFNLINDPAYILSRLKAEQEQQQAEEDEPAQTPRNGRTGSLPWEAVIPAGLLTKHNKTHPSPSPSPPPETGPSSSSYTRLPETPVKNPVLIAHQQSLKRESKFMACLDSSTVDVGALRKLSWAGIPTRLRALVWMILLGYLPAPKSRRKEVLARKRKEYLDAVRLAFNNSNNLNDNTHHLDQSIWHQIKIDVARTNPNTPLWQFHQTQRSLERILYVWAIRHPASGYVQGINDLVTPFFEVYLNGYLNDNEDPELIDIGDGRLPKEALDAIEADSFWSLSKLLEGIQDNYIFAQPGIQRQVARMKELCERVDARLYKHLEDEKVEFIQFAFRWINCLLMRELSTKKIIRMWDTYLAEGTAAFSEFHLYVCLAFLVRYSDQLRAMDFQAIIIFLQALPTEQLTEKDLEFLLSQAFMWHSLFQGATGHFIRK